MRVLKLGFAENTVATPILLLARSTLPPAAATVALSSFVAFGL